MNTATLPPWLSPWSSGLVYGQRVYKSSTVERFRPLDRRHRPRLTIYTYGHDTAPILRFSSWSEGGSGAGDGTGSVAGDNGGPVSIPPPPAGPPVRWERVPLDHEPWHLDVPVPIQPPGLDRPGRYDVTIHSDVDYSAPAPPSDALHAWGGVLRGWAAGATLLALLVIIARLAERFLDWKYLLRRRRMHREWQRANVRATCRLEGDPLPAELSDVCSVDLPPPYSACTPPAADDAPKNDDRIEEPPPPYSDSCVQFINKNGIPVLVYSRDPNEPDEEGQRQVERFLQACGINMTSATQTITAGNTPETYGIDVDENVGMITCCAPTATEALEAVNVNGDADLLSDVENETKGVTNNADVAPNDADGAPNDTHGAPIDNDVVSIVNNVPKDGSVIV